MNGGDVMIGQNRERPRGWRALLTTAVIVAASAPGLVAGTASAAGPPPPIGPTTTYTQPSGASDETNLCDNSPYTVPSNATRVRVVVIGDSGTSGANSSLNGGTGGKGEKVQADLDVTPGESLDVNVADNGYRGIGSSSGSSTGTSRNGGSGGDPSYISTASQPQGQCALDSFLVIAGGGGGGGGGAPFGTGGTGADAGFIQGSDGGYGDHNGAGAGTGGGGGTQTAGGAGGNPATSVGGTLGGAPGTFLHGGCGAGCNGDNDDQSGAGGGGGGYYGGGAGGDGQARGGGGGGGGSSFVTDGATFISHSETSDEPSVSITAVAGAPTAPLMLGADEGNQQATVSFLPPTLDGGAPIQHYTVTEFPGGVRTQGSSSPITVKNLTAGGSYTFSVTATNKLGDSPASARSNAVVPYRRPAAPVITTVKAGDGQAKVTFTPSPDDLQAPPGKPGLPGPNPISYYTVTARPGVNVTSGPGISVQGFVAVNTANFPAGPVTVTGLTNGQNYTFTVTATNDAGTGPQSKPVVAFPQTVPGAPTDVFAANATPIGASAGTATVSFNPPADNGGRPILNYTVTSSPGNITVTAGAAAGGGTQQVRVTGLTIGTSYTFTVRATSAAGKGPVSDPSNAVTPTPIGIPSPPLTPSAAPMDQAAYVSCTPPFDTGGSPITSYTVTSSPGGITETGDSCPLLVTGLTDGTTYTFTVTATNADGGTSEPSQPTTSITPHVPSGKAPKNDDFANAQAISGATGSVSGTNVGATLEPGEPSIQDGEGASVWYKWIAPSSTPMQFNTCSAYPAVVGRVGAFIGSSIGNLTYFGPGGPSSTDCPTGQVGSTIFLNPIAGQTLYVKFVGVRLTADPSEGPFTITWAPQN